MVCHICNFLCAILLIIVNNFAYRRIFRLKMDDVKRVWKSADCVCLDVDSTVILDEGIDMLAEFFGKGEEVANM